MATQPKLYCTMKDHWAVEKNFWQSDSMINANGFMHICSDCANELFDNLYKKAKKLDLEFILDSDSIIFDEITDMAFKEACRYIDMCFNYDAYGSMQSHLNTVKNSGRKVNKIFGVYKNKLSTVVKNNAGVGMTYEFSDEVITKTLESNEIVEYEADDLKNKNDVITLLGYDPFESEKESDKRYLYNTLIDYLDESTLDDSFKLPVVIEITKGFNQLNHVNRLISNIEYASPEAVGKIKTLISAKDTMMKTLLAMAKDNGISVNHNNNKSKGGNTLNGVVKKLNEIGLSTAEINLFDLETCEAMKQIADFSNKSILDQLMFDDNDYTDIIAQQRDLIKKLDDELIKVKEENRLLKVKYNIISKEE